MRGPSGLTSKQEARLRERFEEDRRRFRREDLPRILAEAQGSLERLEGAEPQESFWDLFSQVGHRLFCPA